MPHLGRATGDQFAGREAPLPPAVLRRAAIQCVAALWVQPAKTECLSYHCWLSKCVTPSHAPSCDLQSPRHRPAGKSGVLHSDPQPPPARRTPGSRSATPFARLRLAAPAKRCFSRAGREDCVRVSGPIARVAECLLEFAREVPMQHSSRRKLILGILGSRAMSHDHRSARGARARRPAGRSWQWDAERRASEDSLRLGLRSGGRAL